MQRAMFGSMALPHSGFVLVSFTTDTIKDSCRCQVPGLLPGTIFVCKGDTDQDTMML